MEDVAEAVALAWCLVLGFTLGALAQLQFGNLLTAIIRRQI